MFPKHSPIQQVVSFCFNASDFYHTNLYMRHHSLMFSKRHGTEIPKYVYENCTCIYTHELTFSTIIISLVDFCSIYLWSKFHFKILIKERDLYIRISSNQISVHVRACAGEWFWHHWLTKSSNTYLKYTFQNY